MSSTKGEHSYRRKMGVPGRTEANVVVAIAVPVVDVEAVLVEVADT